MQVCQSSIVASHEKHFHIVYAVLKKHISQDPEYKVCSNLFALLVYNVLVSSDIQLRAYIMQVLVFCTTAMVTRLMAELLAELKFNVREIHSRKPQAYRTRVSNEFRNSKGLILVTSDVSARGVDYPDVTLVVQVIVMHKF